MDLHVWRVLPHRLHRQMKPRQNITAELIFQTSSQFGFEITKDLEGNVPQMRLVYEQHSFRTACTCTPQEGWEMAAVHNMRLKFRNTVDWAHRNNLTQHPVWIVSWRSSSTLIDELFRGMTSFPRYRTSLTKCLLLSLLSENLLVIKCTCITEYLARGGVK